MNEEMVINGDISIEGLTEKEAKEFKVLLTRMMKSYEKKGEGVTVKDWLASEYMREMPELSKDKAAEMAEETVDAVREYDENLESLNAACDKGKRREHWFADKAAEAGIGMSVIDYGNYLNNIDTAMSNANAQMIRAVSTKAGETSQCMNLDGFIAEQHHVNEFNIRAALQKSKYRAEVKIPGPGETYGKNSFDIVINNTANTTMPRVHQYQVKYGKDASETIRLLRDAEKHCKYANQRILVPAEQVEVVQEAFPNKTVCATIGGTDKVSIESTPLTKQQAKDMQLGTQRENSVPKTDWNSFSTKEAALNLGKSAGRAGVQAALITTGISLAQAVCSGEEFDGEKTVELALTTGADAGIKAVTAGALKVGVEKGIIKIIPKGTPAGVIANIACVAIENIKIMTKAATGELTATQALDHMGRTTTTMVAGLLCGAKGATIGATALSWIPIVGPVVGGLAGGMIGYMAGSKVADKVYSGFKKVGSAAKNIVSRGLNKAKSIGRGIKSVLFG